MTTRFKTTRLRQGFGGQAFAATLIALSLAAAAPVFAQDAQPRRGGPGIGGSRAMRGGGMDLRGLDLTDDQRAQLRKIRDARQPEFKAAGEKLRTAREGMRALIEADSINESAIRAKSQEVAAAEAEVAILNAKVRGESMQILTSEQQQKMKELRASRPGPRRRGQ